MLPTLSARTLVPAVLLMALAPSAAAQPAVLVNHTRLDWLVEPALPPAAGGTLRLVEISAVSRVRTGEALAVVPGTPARGAGAARFVLKHRHGLRLTLDHREGKAAIPLWISCERPGAGGERFSFLLRFTSDWTQGEQVSTLRELAECPVHLEPPFRLGEVHPHELDLLPAGTKPAGEVKTLPAAPSCAIL